MAAPNLNIRVVLIQMFLEHAILKGSENCVLSCWDLLISTCFGNTGWAFALEKGGFGLRCVKRNIFSADSKQRRVVVVAAAGFSTWLSGLGSVNSGTVKTHYLYKECSNFVASKKQRNEGQEAHFVVVVGLGFSF